MTQITLLSRPDDLPSFEQALQSLERVPDILFRGLENAAYRTSRFKTKESPTKPLDAGLTASLFRFHAIEFLQSEGIDAQPDEWKWTFNKLPFLGISFYYANHHIRILKGPGGSLPGCGISRRKARFYRQLPTNYLVGSQPRRSVANLVLLWDLTPSYDLAGLWLTLPAKSGMRQQDVSAYWCESLEHPAEHVNVTPDVDPSGGGLGNLIEPLDNENAQEKNDRRQDSTG